MQTTEIINIETFAGLMEKVIQYHFEGYTTQIVNVTKNNNTKLTGISVRKPDATIAPTIYMDDYFSEMLNGRLPDDIITDVIHCVQKGLNDISDDTLQKEVAKITDFDSVKDLICYKLVNKDQNKETLANAPYRDYLDLAIRYYVPVVALNHKCESAIITVNNDIMKYWNVNEAKLYELASVNTPMLRRGSVTPLNIALGKHNPEETEYQKESTTIIPYHNFDFCKTPYDSIAYILTTPKELGASAILYKDLLKHVAEQIGNFYILPSSIHEMIILREVKGSDDSKMLQAMVRDINNEDVLAQDEILSNSCYYYDAKTDTISVTQD